MSQKGCFHLHLLTSVRSVKPVLRLPPLEIQVGVPWAGLDAVLAVCPPDCLGNEGGELFFIILVSPFPEISKSGNEP